MEDKESTRHFTMIRDLHLSDTFTLANGLLGVIAVFHAMKFLAAGDSVDLYVAVALVPLALVLDIFDGYTARKRETAGAMGRELDSLADLISFGVAPATIAFSIGLNTVLDQIFLLYFVISGLSRLARFNVTAELLSDARGKVKYFEGTPIPTSIVPLGITVWAYSKDALFPVEFFHLKMHLISLLFVLSGSLMISKTVHIPKP